MSEKLDLLIKHFVSEGKFRNISIKLHRYNSVVYEQELLAPDHIISPVYLVASLTKPLVALGLLKLVEQGELLLQQKVTDFLPAFKADGRMQITLRHLLSHTSGLPDLPPDNVELRLQETPLATFLDRSMSLPLEFAPGKNSRYSSLGFMVLAAVLENVTGQNLSDYLKQTLFQPLGMHDTCLGLPKEECIRQQFLERIVPVEMTADEIEKYGDWNSNYWRSLGAPWGGLLSTTHDMIKFCQMITQDGCANGQQLLNPATIKCTLTNQLQHYPDLPLEAQLRPWGLGWRMNWINHRQAFSELLPVTVAGHYGATGTLMWIDKETKTSCLILSSTPQERCQKELIKISNVLATLP